MASPVTFEGSILLMIAIIFGIIASVMTYLNSRKLKDDVFEMPMVYFSLGILFATVSLITVTFSFGLSEFLKAMIHDISFILGLALMLTASVRLTKFLKKVDKFDEKLSSVDKKEETKK